MCRWRITIAIHPHSTGNGQEADRIAAGSEGGDRYFYLNAEEFEEAVRCAGFISEGIKSHPMVWEAPIVGVHRYPISRDPE